MHNTAAQAEPTFRKTPRSRNRLRKVWSLFFGLFTLVFLQECSFSLRLRPLPPAVSFQEYFLELFGPQGIDLGPFSGGQIIGRLDSDIASGQEIFFVKS
jgi:hypothetical protein